MLDRFKEYRGHSDSAEVVVELKEEVVELRRLLSEVSVGRLEEVQRGE